MKESPRELVLDMLLAINEERMYSHILIKDVLHKYNYWDSRDKDFVKRLTEGTLERMLTIDYILDQYSRLPTAKMKPLIRNLLRMASYQILYLDTVPDSAACNEAVKLAEKRGFNNLKGFVNGILRTVSRQKAAIVWPDAVKTPVRYWSVFYAMPEWLVEKWLTELGAEQTPLLLAGLLQIRPVSVRLRGDLDQAAKNAWLDDLQAAGVTVKSHPYLAAAYELSHAPGVQNLPGFAEGLFTVQDVSSMLAVAAADLKPTDFLFDVCAAPGGKALYGAEQAARVLAADLSFAKTALIRENAVRMRINNIEIIEHDARILKPELRETADVVLADLPCSGLGIIGKKRDIKYKITAQGIEEIMALQREILQTVWQYVKPGGLLIYSTCTVSYGENEGMMAWFTGQFPFRREAFPKRYRTFAGEEYDGSEENNSSENHCGKEGDRRNNGDSGMLQFLPGLHPTDGFFICRLRRDKAETRMPQVTRGQK